MRLAYKFKNYQNNDELLRLCKISKDLYNQALYIVKTNLIRKKTGLLFMTNSIGL